MIRCNLLATLLMAALVYGVVLLAVATGQPGAAGLSPTAPFFELAVGNCGQAS